jgi:hypothetical protein
VLERLEDRWLLICTNLVGVDFDQVGGISPGNWTQVNGFEGDVRLENLPTEAGYRTPIGLSVFGDASTTLVAATPAPQTIPAYAQSLAGLDGYILANDSLIMSWTGLTAGTEYEIWVFGYGSDERTQWVELNHGAVILPLDSPANDLVINGEAGSSSRPLDAYSVTVVPVGFNGQISMLVRSTTDDRGDLRRRDPRGATSRAGNRRAGDRDLDFQRRQLGTHER